jgi:hypothetical protein
VAKVVAAKPATKPVKAIAAAPVKQEVAAPAPEKASDPTIKKIAAKRVTSKK